MHGAMESSAWHPTVCPHCCLAWCTPLTLHPCPHPRRWHRGPVRGPSGSARLPLPRERKRSHDGRWVRPVCGALCRGHVLEPRPSVQGQACGVIVHKAATVLSGGGGARATRSRAMQRGVARPGHGRGDVCCGGAAKASTLRLARGQISVACGLGGQRRVAAAPPCQSARAAERSQAGCLFWRGWAPARPRQREARGTRQRVALCLGRRRPRLRRRSDRHPGCRPPSARRVPACLVG
jgi:hypothetical protein